MSDPAHTATDEILNRLERRLKREYTQAAREVQKKLDDYLAAFKIKDAEWQRRVAAGEATAKEYKNWRTGQMMMGKRWGQLQQECAENLANANQIAHSIAYGYQSEVYALNHNFATYEIEHSGRLDTAYTLYDKDTVARLMRDDPDMLPPPGKTVKERIAQGKDVLWNKQQLQSVMMQAIVQGESIDKIAKRMSEAVATSDYKAAVRYARTMTTNTQNAGRYEGYRRAKGMGVDLTIEWSATLDNRTRHDHRLLHGQRREVDEPFEVDNIKILYPAQLGVGSSDIPQSMIWNCRCTLLAWVKGFEGETVKSSPKMGGMTFEEWQNMKEDDPRYKAERYKKGDQEQYADYKKLLGKNAPKSFGEFQQVKYYDADKYAEWKKQAAEKRSGKKEQKKTRSADTKPYISSGSLPPDEREFDTIAEYFAESNKYKGGKKFYSAGSAEFYGPKYYGYYGNEFNSVKEFSTTINKLYSDFPLPNGFGLDIGDYEVIDSHLTEIQIARKDDDAAGQLWRNHETKRYTIGYRPSTSVYSYEEELATRERAIKNGDVLIDICGASPNGLAIHEYGHALSDYISNAMIHDDETAIEYWEWYKSLSKEEIKKGLSSYAATNRMEFEAECFAELLCPNPRPLAKQYQKYLAKCMEKNYNETGQGDPVVSAITKLLPRRNVGDMPTYILPKKEYAHVMSELATWVKTNECPLGTMQVHRIFDEVSEQYCVYYFERIGVAEFRVVHKEVI